MYHHMSIRARSGCSAWNPGTSSCEVVGGTVSSQHGALRRLTVRRRAAPAAQGCSYSGTSAPASLLLLKLKMEPNTNKSETSPFRPWPLNQPWDLTLAPSAHHTAAALTDQSRSSAHVRQGPYTHLSSVPRSQAAQSELGA